MKEKTEDHEKVLTELEVMEKKMLEMGKLHIRIAALKEELRVAKILGTVLEPDVCHRHQATLRPKWSTA